MKYKNGELIVLSIGLHSSYSVEGLVRAIKDFDASLLVEEWAKENAIKLESNSVVKYTRNIYRKTPEGTSFPKWLNENGYTEDVNYRELHIGDWGEVDLSEWE
ncbi:hypothetical protein F546_05125 [Vibrio paracholerae 877-163]|nr:hypothetical protein F546_05125 [Vibrio paracholerae 877-163]